MALPTVAAPTPPGRPHTERLRFDLDQIRGELIEAAGELTPDVFSQALAPDARSPRELLQEIGTMEECTRRWVSHREMLDWMTVWQRLDGNTPAAIMAKLADVRADTLAYLDHCTEAELETPVALPEEWTGYFGELTMIEPEELLRWLVRHEYYHLGQLNTYRFLRAAGK